MDGDRRASEIVSLLQPHVACAPVLGVPELHTDPQVVHRGYWVPHDHPVYGTVPVLGDAGHRCRAHPAPCPARRRASARTRWYVLESILGVDGDTIGLLLADNVLEITG